MAVSQYYTVVVWCGAGNVADLSLWVLEKRDTDQAAVEFVKKRRLLASQSRP